MKEVSCGRKPNIGQRETERLTEKNRIGSMIHPVKNAETTRKRRGKKGAAVSKTSG